MADDQGRGPLADESGAATVDWVILTAAVATLAVAVVPGIFGGTVGVAEDTDRVLSAIEPGK